MDYVIIHSNEFYHHGIKGQRWGHRRYQNEDGTLTIEGKARYRTADGKMLSNSDDSNKTKKVKSDWNNLSDEEFRKKYGASKDTYAKRVRKYGDPYMNSPMAKVGKKLNERIKTNAKIDKVYEELDKNASKSEKIWFNDNVRRKAAKYVVEKNMTVEEAMKKAKT